MSVETCKACNGRLDTAMSLLSNRRGYFFNYWVAGELAKQREQADQMAQYNVWLTELNRLKLVVARALIEDLVRTATSLGLDLGDIMYISNGDVLFLPMRQRGGIIPPAIQYYGPPLLRCLTTAQITELEDPCPICYEFPLNVPVQMCCDGGHIYCRQCIELWLLERTSCPICRYDFGDMMPPEVDLSRVVVDTCDLAQLAADEGFDIELYAGFKPYHYETDRQFRQRIRMLRRRGGFRSQIIASANTQSAARFWEIDSLVEH